MRLFFAVVAAERVKKVVKKAVDSFPVTVPPWRWIPPENYHMTLKFLGEVEDKFLPSLHDAALRVASNTGSFQIIYGRFGGFPSLSRPRVIFYRIEEGAEELSSLAGLLEDEAERLGFEKERRPFRAHLTLARIKRRFPLALGEKLKDVSPLPPYTAQEVDHFVLMRSHLSRGGALYEEIYSFELPGGR
ncbi:MAG: RNA 2',3'-cyclic phosphodiesterase [Candidatus Krumholzibacteria bacterium]|nr:RNA 2',3'-cyclic phosphodiesterase [Candidatus Krumholzibacteria bacterium]